MAKFDCWPICRSCIIGAIWCVLGVIVIMLVVVTLAGCTLTAHAGSTAGREQQMVWAEIIVSGFESPGGVENSPAVPQPRKKEIA